MSKAVQLFSFAFFLVLFLILCKSLFLNFYPDLSQYYFGAKAANPYLNGVIYPPFALVIFSLLTVFPFALIEKIWTVLSIISLFTAVYLVFKIYNKKIISTLGFLILGLVCFSFPVKFTLGMGQINNFILLLFVAAIYFLNKKRDYLASFLLVFSFTIKLFPSFLLLNFFLAKKWKVLFAFSFFAAILSLAAFFLIDPKTNLYFYQHFLATLLTGWKTDYYNQSLTGFISRSLARNFFSQILIDSISILFILASALAVFKSLKNKTLANMSFGLLITLNLIVNNFSWQHHFVFLIFPFLATLFYALAKKQNRKFLVLLFISYVLASFNLANPKAVPILLQSHVLYGAVLLWILEVYLIWKDSPRLQLNFPAKAQR